MLCWLAADELHDVFLLISDPEEVLYRDLGGGAL